MRKLFMPSMTRYAIILFCLLSLPVRANLGETIEQCVARYGRPVGYSEASAKLPFGTVVYTAGGYTLVVFLMKNQEVGARVSKADNSAFTDTERLNIINADVLAGAPWKATTSDDPGTLRWIRADKATALYDKDKHVLIFTSDEMAVAMRAAQQAPAAVAPAPVTKATPVVPAPPTAWPAATPSSGPAPADAGKSTP